MGTSWTQDDNLAGSWGRGSCTQPETPIFDGAKMCEDVRSFKVSPQLQRLSGRHWQLSASCMRRGKLRYAALNAQSRSWKPSSDSWRTPWADSIRWVGRPLWLHFSGWFSTVCEQMHMDIIWTWKYLQIIHQKKRRNAWDEKTSAEMRLTEAVAVVPCGEVISTTMRSPSKYLRLLEHVGKRFLSLSLLSSLHFYILWSLSLSSIHFNFCIHLYILFYSILFSLSLSLSFSLFLCCCFVSKSSSRLRVSARNAIEAL